MSTKLYLLIFIPFFLITSCVDNSDEGKDSGGGGGTVPQELLELNEENILGTWELYFYNKTIYAPALNLNTKYRYTDEDGFSITFKENGVFYEKNVFDMYTIEGEYEFVKNPVTNKNDSIKFHFDSNFTGKDTTTWVSIPYLYRNRFIYHSKYHGTSKGYLFNVEDLKYYRNMERDPNYYPSDNPAFKKTLVNEDDLLGTWYLFKSEIRLDEVWSEGDTKAYGTLLIFSIENGERIFEHYAPNNQGLVRRGKYRIVDDVIHMYVVEDLGGGKTENKSFQYWVRDWKITGGTEIMIEGFTARYKENILQEVEERSYHRKVK